MEAPSNINSQLLQHSNAKQGNAIHVLHTFLCKIIPLWNPTHKEANSTHPSKENCNSTKAAIAHTGDCPNLGSGAARGLLLS